MKNPVVWMALVALCMVAACSATPKVARLDANAVTDLSGRWNDTDSRLVAEEMIQDCLSRPWMQTAQKSSERPVVIVQNVRNRSMEHINTATFVEELQRALINSGLVDFVASASERGQLRSERAEQDLNATEATRKAMGQEIGADYSLNGEVNAILDRDGGVSVMAYQINLKLTHIESNRIVWNGMKKIKKQIQRPETSF